MSTYASQLSGNTASYLPMASTNDTDLFRNVTLNVYYWITKDTHHLKKTDVLQVFTLDPQSLGLPAKGPERQEMRIISETSMLFEGFNESVNIVLPPEARNAQPSPPGSVASDEAVPVASAEGEMGLSEPTSRIDESKSRLNESMSRLNEPMPDPAKLDELKSRLNESMPDPAKLDELKARLNESMPDPAKLDELKARLNETIANATRSNEALANATKLNETMVNATKLNDSMQENKMTQATSTAWRIFF
jgi:BMFP domain-containing protein YqiC